MSYNQTPHNLPLMLNTVNLIPTRYSGTIENIGVQEEAIIEELKQFALFFLKSSLF